MLFAFQNSDTRMLGTRNLLPEPWVRMRNLFIQGWVGQIVMVCLKKKKKAFLHAPPPKSMASGIVI